MPLRRERRRVRAFRRQGRRRGRADSGEPGCRQRARSPHWCPAPRPAPDTRACLARPPLPPSAEAYKPVTWKRARPSVSEEPYFWRVIDTFGPIQSRTSFVTVAPVGKCATPKVSATYPNSLDRKPTVGFTGTPWIGTGSRVEQRRVQ